MRPFASVLIASLLLAPLAASADEPADASAMSPEMKAYMDAATPGPQHASLVKQAGSYDLVVKTWMAPGAEPEVTKGTAQRKMILGDRVLSEDMQGTMMGAPYMGHGLFGYDNVVGRWWSTWNDTMGTGLMVSDGTCDDKGACEFKGTWNDAVTKQPVHARMTTHWTSPGVQVFEMNGPGPDGKEVKMMEITYTKK